MVDCGEFGLHCGQTFPDYLARYLFYAIIKSVYIEVNVNKLAYVAYHAGPCKKKE